MQVPGQNHRDPWFAPWFTQILKDTKYIFRTTEGTPFLFPGTGTGGWEAALTNTLSPGDKVVCFRYGQFSHLWIDMMQRLGLDVQIVDCPWGEGADEGILEDILKKDTAKKIKAVCVVHNETTTGVTRDIAGCRQAMDSAKHPALLMVDGVSSIGALDFRMDEWRVDVAVTGSQKALSLPTGLAVVAASPKVRTCQAGFITGHNHGWIATCSHCVTRSVHCIQHMTKCLPSYYCRWHNTAHLAELEQLGLAPCTPVQPLSMQHPTQHSVRYP